MELTLTPFAIIDPAAEIFRAYDIRGIVPKTLNPNTAYTIGRAYAYLAAKQNENTVIIGRDGRLSSPSLHEALVQGIIESGLHVIDVGIVPTPLLYFATKTLSAHNGIMITGSHNPADYNGFKMILKNKTLSEADINAIHDVIKAKTFSSTTVRGSVSQADVFENYIAHIQKTVPLKRPLKIVIDCGNGAASVIAPELYKRLGCDVIALYAELDGRFPNHHPDPLVPENLNDLIAAVRNHGADIGLAFDGDADRIGVVDSGGNIIWPDRQMMLYAIAILARYPKRKIVYDVKCSGLLTQIISEHGGTPVMAKTGHSLIKNKMLAENAPLAGELSGHIFFNDERWFGFDDGMYVGVRLLEILSEQEKSSEQLFATIPNSVNTPELKINIAEHEKFNFMTKLIAEAEFANAQKITIDGLRVEFQHGWGLVRPSNTSPALTVRFEAKDQQTLLHIQHLFKQQLLRVQPNLNLPF